MKVSKFNCKHGDAATEAIPFLKKIFGLVKSSGDHVLALVPYNQAINAKPLINIEMVEERKATLKGKYIVHIDRQNWNEKIIFDCCVESTMDLCYLLTQVNTRGSPECEAMQHFLKSSHYKVQIEDIEESTKIPVVVIGSTMPEDESPTHKKEFITLYGNANQL
jgi:hypothetical protein